MDLIIRKAVLDDTETVYRFICELKETIFDPHVFYRYYLHNLNNEKNHYLVAVTDNEVIGFASCHGQLLLHHMGWAYEIQEFYVDKDYRSKGIGKHLLNALEHVLSKENYDVLELTSNMKRTQAHKFYLDNGFEQTHYKFTKKGNQ
jgi:PhnO protein